MRILCVLVALLLLSTAAFADDKGGRKVVTVPVYNSSGAIAAANPITVTGSDQTSEVMVIKWSEFQSVGITIAAGPATTIGATYVVEYSQADGSEVGIAAAKWDSLAATTITSTYDDTAKLSLPVCKLIRIKFTLDTDGSVEDYTVTRCNVSRY